MKVVFGEDRRVAEFIEKGTGSKFCEPYTAIGFERGNEICFGAVYNNWNGSNIEVSIYGPDAVTREVIASVLRYPFRQLKASRLTAKTKRSNKLMRQIMPRMGFVFEGIQKRYFGPAREDDALLYAMFPEQAEKWMR